MARLDLDFRRVRRAPAWAGRVLLALAAVLAADVGLSYQAARQALDGNRARLARPAAPAVKASPQEVAAARDTVQRLSLPWNELFVALESAASDQVALAAIEPDARAGTVTITGDGKDYLAALNYVLELSRSEGLERVQLVRHDQKANGVSFAVSAAWGTK